MDPTLYRPSEGQTNYQSIFSSLWVSGITSRATESYFTSFLSVAVHFIIQNIRYTVVQVLELKNLHVVKYGIYTVK